MKTFKIILAGFLILFLLFGLALFIFIKTFDTVKLKVYLEKELNASVGRSVSLGSLHLNVSLLKGLTLEVGDVRISDDPSFSKESLFAARQLKCNVDIMAFLLRRQVRVSSITVVSPEIHLVRNKAGAWNVSQLRAAGENSSQASPQGPSSGLAGSEPAKAQAVSHKDPAVGVFPQIFIQSIQLEKGKVLLSDESFQPPVRLEIKDVDLWVRGFSLTAPFDFDINGALAADKDNFRFKGQGRIDLVKNQVQLDDVQISAEISSVVWPRLVQMFPPLANLTIKGGFNGKIDGTVQQMVIGNKGLVSLVLTGNMSAEKVSFQTMPVAVEDISASFRMTEKNFEVLKSSARVASGQMNATATVSEYTTRPKLFMDAVMKDVSLGELIPQGNPFLKFSGRISGKAKMTGENLTSADVLKTLLGQASASVAEGKWIGVNVLRVVLDQMSMIPNLVEKIEEKLPEKYKEQLKREDTLFEKVVMELNAQDGVIALSKAELAADAFSLLADGVMDGRQNLTLNANIYVPADLSAVMVSAVEELQSLLEADGRIRIPLQRYEGPAESFRIFPDLEYLAKRLIVSRGKEEIKRLLDDVFNKGEEPNTTSDPGGASPSGQPPEKPAEQQIIEGILDNIFQ